MDPDQGADITMDITQWDQAAADEVRCTRGRAATVTYQAGPASDLAVQISSTALCERT